MIHLQAKQKQWTALISANKADPQMAPEAKLTLTYSLRYHYQGVIHQVQTE